MKLKWSDTFLSRMAPVKRFITTQHYSSYYLYAEHAGRES